MPEKIEVKTLEDMQKQDKNQTPGVIGDKEAKQEIFSLESLEREKMERDRAGILFSNILS